VRVDPREKLRRAALLLLLRRHRYPGAREWELRRYLGEGFEEVIKVLDQRLRELGLRVKRVRYGDGEYYAVVLDRPIESAEFRSYGWRVDEMAILAVAVGYILSRGGSAPRKEVESLLEEKIPRWRVERSIERFVRMGYLEQEGEDLKLGVRSYIELDLERLVKLLVGAEEPSGTSRGEPSSQPRESA